MSAAVKSPNPYKTHKGFGLRVHRAETAIRKLGLDKYADVHTRGFDNCFEMYDGSAVVFALMAKAKLEPDQYGQSPLTQGIQNMFSTSLDENGQFPQWEKIYQDGLLALKSPDQGSLL